jgi:Zn-dependent protease
MKEPQPVPGSILTFRVFEVPVRLHFTFVLLIIFLIVVGAGGGQSMLASAIYLIALFSSVLLHELGHVAVSKRYGIATIEIVMFPIGGVARLERLPKPHEELWIALAGPLVNVLIAGALFAWLGWANDIRNLAELVVPTDRNLIQRIAVGNLILAAFNMLPAFPMDGGRVLRALIARSKGEAEATRIAAGAGQALAIGMGLLGLLGGNFMLVFIALFVYLGAAQENAVVQGRFLLANTPVRSAMITDFRTIPHGSSLREAADLLLATSQQDFPVVTGDQVLGLLTRNNLLRGMASEGADSYVAASMNRNFVRVTPDAELAEAVPLLAQDACLLVMDDDRLLGLLTRENVAEYLMLRRFGLAPRAA